MPLSLEKDYKKYEDGVNRLFEIAEEYIKKRDYSDIYSLAEFYKQGNEYRKQFTMFNLILIKAGINPLLYVTEVPKGYLYDSDIPSFVIPNGIKIIREYAFASCSNLKTITIPKSVTLVCEHSFAHCKSLKKILYEGTKKEFDSIEFEIDWSYNTFADEIICTDGKLEL